MLRKLISNRLAAYERDFGYDATYIREVLAADLGAFWKLSKLQGIADYRHAVPVEAWHAARVAGAQAQDCGPCTQLMVSMAERAGVSPDTLRAVLVRDEAAMDPDVRLCVSFVRAVFARDARADELRDQVLARWGRRGLVTLAFATVGASVFPTLKYAMGYGRACTRVTVGGVAIAPKPAREPAVGVIA